MSDYDYKCKHCDVEWSGPRDALLCKDTDFNERCIPVVSEELAEICRKSAQNMYEAFGGQGMI